MWERPRQLLGPCHKNLSARDPSLRSPAEPGRARPPTYGPGPLRAGGNVGRREPSATSALWAYVCPPAFRKWPLNHQQAQALGQCPICAPAPVKVQRCPVPTSLCPLCPHALYPAPRAPRPPTNPDRSPLRLPLERKGDSKGDPVSQRDRVSESRHQLAAFSKPELLPAQTPAGPRPWTADPSGAPTGPARSTFSSTARW